MENQPPSLSVQRLKHRKSNSYIVDYADRSNLLISDTKGAPGMITIVFGRDIAEIEEEEAVALGDGTANMVPKVVTAFRYDVASITLPEYAAKGLADAILASLSRKSKGASEV